MLRWKVAELQGFFFFFCSYIRIKFKVCFNSLCKVIYKLQI